jgi:putative ABC transport system permease protein
MKGTLSIDGVLQDLRYAARGLWRSKAFTSAAVLTLVAGVGAVTVMFALINGVLVRPLPVHEQERLIVAWREGRTSGFAQHPFGDIEVQAVARASRLLERVAGVSRNGVRRTVVGDGGSTYANVALVTGGFFEVLGVNAALGRTLTTSDDREGAEQALVISSGYWQRRYGSDPAVLGRRVMIDGRPFTIVGVMPPDLDYPTGVEIWRTTMSVPTDGPFGDAARREVNLIGRMRDGVSVAQAQSELIAINERLLVEAPTNFVQRGFLPVARPFVDVVIGDARMTMLALFAAVVLLLLIASANVANLLLMRGEARRAEWALRSALGAARGRIVRQVLAESLLLSMTAGVAGAALASAALPILITIVPDGLPRVESIRIDGVVVAFAVALILVTTLLAGLVPGLLAARGDLISSLSTGAATVVGGGATRGRRVLVVGQVALAVAVLAAAGLLIRSVLRLHTIDLGIAADRLVLLELYMPPARFADRTARAQFLDQAIVQLEGLPAVAAATPVNMAPFTDRGWDVPRIAAEGQSADEAAANPSLNLESIHPNYFSTLEIPIVRGRPFTAADRDGAVRVAIVSQDLAGRLWPGQDAVGRRLKMGPADSPAGWLQVVGVAAETRYRTVTASRPTLYMPAAQFQMTASMLVVRTSAPVERLTTTARERIADVHPDVQLMQVAPFAHFLDRPFARPRFSALLLGLFGVAALSLAGVGLYAVMAAHVGQRRRELALRLALGAEASGVRRLVLGEVVRLAVPGVLIGVASAFVISRLLRGMLFEISPMDPISFASAALLLMMAAALASYAPLRRATRLDLLTTLRAP